MPGESPHRIRNGILGCVIIALCATTNPERVRESFDRTGVAFLFAQRYHAGMRFAANVRRYLGFKTLFNLLGPLTNPAGVVRHAIGVYDPKVVPVIAQTLLRLGCRRALVFSGVDGMDEISPVGVTLVAEVRDGEVKTGIFDGSKVAGLGADTSLDELAGGNAQENAAILRATLRGEVRGVCRAAVLLNAAAAIVAGEKADTLEEGYRLAEESIDSGRALEKLEEFVSCNSRNR